MYIVSKVLCTRREVIMSANLMSVLFLWGFTPHIICCRLTKGTKVIHGLILSLCAKVLNINLHIIQTKFSLWNIAQVSKLFININKNNYRSACINLPYKVIKNPALCMWIIFINFSIKTDKWKVYDFCNTLLSNTIIR